MEPNGSQPQAPTQQSIPQVQPVQNADNPGQTLGIVSLVTGIMCLGVVGLITGIMGLVKSKRAGQKNPFAVAGIIVSIITSILISGIVLIAVMGTNGLIQKCRELGPGTHRVGNSTYTCGATNTSSNSSFTE